MKTKLTLTTATALAALTAFSAPAQSATQYIKDLVVVQVLRTSKPASAEPNGGPFGGCMARVIPFSSLDEYLAGDYSPVPAPITLTSCSNSYWVAFDCHGMYRDADAAEGLFAQAQSALVTNWSLFIGPDVFPSVNLLVTNDVLYNGYCRADRIDVVTTLAPGS